MISLSNFVNIYENEDLYLHLLAEYYRCSEYDLILINEYHSVPTDFDNIWKYCTIKVIKEYKNHSKNKIFHSQKLKYNVIVNLDEIKTTNLFVSFVEFDITEIAQNDNVGVSGEYKNNKIYLTIPSNSNKYDIGSIILHELVHYYRDKQFKKIGSSLLSKLNSDSYNKYKNYIASEDDEQEFKHLLYMTNEEEIYGYAVGIKPLIEEKYPKTPSEAVNVLKNTSEYIFFKNLVDLTENGKLIEKFPDIINFYNKIFNKRYNDEDIDVVEEKIRKRILKSYNKFLKIVSKFCIDCVPITIDSKDIMNQINRK